MGTLIDTSVVVAAERGTLDLEAVLRTADEFAMSAVTVSELLHGVHRAPRGRARTLRQAFVEQVIARVPAIPFDTLAARAHARLWADLAARGVTVGERDLLIGATAVAHGHRIATRDKRSFPRIPGLAVAAW